MWLTDRGLGIPIPGGLVLAVPDVDGLFLLKPSIWAELRLGSDADSIARRLVEAFGRQRFGIGRKPLRIDRRKRLSHI
jgi:hypothetical protein